MKRFKNQWWFNLVLTLIGVALVFLIWIILSLSINSSLFPDPLKVFGTLGYLLSDAYTYKSIGFTLLRLLISFLGSALLGLVLGTISGLLPSVRRILSPLILVMRTVPTAALILVMIVLLKTELSLFLIVFLVMFPLIYESVVKGITKIDEPIMMALRLETSKFSPRALFKVILPTAGPYIELGLIQSLGLGMKVSIMSEIIIGDPKIPGLGIMLNTAYQYTQMDRIFAIAIIAIVLIGITDTAFKIAKNKLNSNRHI